MSTRDGCSVRGRAYPWGVIEVDNEEHCDFVKLRQMLIRTNMEELREHTNDVLYERTGLGKAGLDSRCAGPECVQVRVFRFHPLSSRLVCCWMLYD